eukprot:scaffold111083_cov45-Phaeocystis_antarctica.AAC.2
MGRGVWPPVSVMAAVPQRAPPGTSARSGYLASPGHTPITANKELERKSVGANEYTYCFGRNTSWGKPSECTRGNLMGNLLPVLDDCLGGWMHGWRQLVPTTPLAELRPEQLVQGAAGEAGGEERLRRPRDLPLPIGNLRGGLGAGQVWVSGWIRDGSGA